MSLLSSLLEFSSFQPTSLTFCQSPKEINLNRNTKDIKDITSAKRQEIVTPQKRTVSKSLSKLDLMSFSNAKIDPKQRLLHRMVHKLNMKCRKYYYNFFVVLENLNKKNIQLYQNKTQKPTNPNIKTAFTKIMQLQQILFSKYFSNALKKSSFQALLKWGKHKTALNKIIQIINKIFVNKSFKNIQHWSQKIQNQQIRMDILIDSICHIDCSITNFHKIPIMQTFMRCLKAHNISICAKQNEKQTFKTPPKNKIQSQIIKTTPFTPTHSPFSKEKTNNLLNLFHQNYQNMKTHKKMNEQSPGKPKEPIEVNCQQVKLKIQKCYNYIKNSKCKTNLKEQTIPFNFNKEPEFLISKRCEPIALNFHEIPDLNDKGAIFFNQLFTSFSNRGNNDFAQSSVKIFCKEDTISQTFSQELHNASQVSLITPLTQNNYESPKKNIGTSGVRGTCFGSQAVNFKNSLVIEREMMKDSQGEKIRQKKEFSFSKLKNLVKNEKRAHDEYFQAELRHKIENRPESAQKEYTSVKFRKESEFSISIPLTVNQSANTTSRQAPFIKRSSDTPQPDIRGYYNSQRKHLSLMNNNKVQLSHQDVKRSAGATYLKILSKK